jgi:opacity protein-like surface antigen
MKKKLSSLLILTALFVTANANAQSKKFEGFSVAVGATTVGTRNGLSVTDTSANVNAGLDLGKTDSTLTGEVGYTMPLNNNFAVELGLNADQNNSINAGRFSEGGVAINFTAGSHYSIYIKPMYKINDSSSLFFKLGSHSVKGKTIIKEGAVSSSAEGTYTGTGYGGGIKSYLNNNVFVQAELTLTDYNRKTFVSGDTTTSYQPNSTAGTILVGYQF